MNIKALSVALLGALLAFNAARAEIISTTGAVVVIPAPSDVGVGALESDTQIVLFAERLGFSLGQDLPVNIASPGTSPDGGTANLRPGTIALGTTVNSYLLHFDSATNDTLISIGGSVTFSHDILGLIVHPATLNNTDGVVGIPGLNYPSVGNRGLELTPGDTALDMVTLSADRRTVSFEFLNAQSTDQIRVITAVPEPSTWLLLCVGGCALAAWRSRRRR